MLNEDSFPSIPGEASKGSFCDADLKVLSESALPALGTTAAIDAFDNDAIVEWSEQDIVFLHWRLLKEVGDLRDPATPLEEKFDTLRWVFSDGEKEGRPFSFVNCLKVVGCSPLSPTPYFGLLDADEIRECIRRQIRAWLEATVSRYPPWVREAVFSNPEWVESRLERNPQWINEEVKKHTVQGDLFA